jgi:hypothetical protein
MNYRDFLKKKAIKTNSATFIMHIEVSVTILTNKLSMRSGTIIQIVLKEIRIIANKCGRILII